MISEFKSLKISVVLPSYNSDRYINKAIESFLDQDYQNKELIIVDGKSTDNTHNIIESYTSKYQNIKWVKEKDINVTDAINIGLKHCTGDFISFLAADVYYFNDDIFSTIQKSYSKIKFDIIYFDHYRYFQITNSLYLIKAQNHPVTKTSLLQSGPFSGFDNIFVSNKIYQNYKLNPNYNLASDWEFFLRISPEKPLYLYSEKVCAVDVQDGNNLSMLYADKQMKEVLEVGKLYNTDNIKLYYQESAPSANPYDFKPGITFKIKSHIKNLFLKLGLAVFF